jgi:hypothetical protein
MQAIHRTTSSVRVLKFHLPVPFLVETPSKSDFPCKRGVFFLFLVCCRGLLLRRAWRGGLSFDHESVHGVLPRKRRWELLFHGSKGSLM